MFIHLLLTSVQDRELKMHAAHIPPDSHKTPFPHDYLCLKQMFPNRHKYTVQITGIQIGYGGDPQTKIHT